MHKRMSPHGDYDHMGEAISLVENFKVEKVIFKYPLMTFSIIYPSNQIISYRNL